MMMMMIVTMMTVMLLPQTPPVYVLIHLRNISCFKVLICPIKSPVQVSSVKCIKTRLKQYLPTIPEYEYLSSSPPSSITELDWEGRVRSSSSSELRMEWACLDTPHCWDKTGE